MTRALIATVWLLSAISSSSSSSSSAYYNSYSPYYCNRADCCWALKVNHWNLHNICSGCEGQEVCNNNSRRTPRPTKKPTVTNNGYGGDSGGGVPQNFCCQTTGNCPIDTPVKTYSRQWLDRANRIKLTYCCEYSASSWKGDSWEKGNNNGRSLQALLPLCINTAEPTSSPTSIPSLQPSSTPTASPSATPSTEPSASPSEAPSTAPSSEPSSVPSTIPSSAPSETPSLPPSSDPSSIPSSNPSESPSSTPSDTPSLSSLPSEMPSDLPSASSQPSSNPSESPSSIPSSSPSDTPSLSTAPSVIPSDLPSLSSQPSSSPSESPSSIPSSAPSDIPSLSSLSSIMPSDFPSMSSQPSSNPSETIESIPSSLPSNSNVPSLSSQPSSIPSSSLSPSYIPSSSSEPSLSAQPSTPIRVGVYSQFFRNCDTTDCDTEECTYRTDNFVSIVRHFIVTDAEFTNYDSDTSIQSFADPDLEAKLNNMAMFIMPQIEEILSGWVTASQTILENYVADGGILLVASAYLGIQFLNEIFGWGLIGSGCSFTSTSKNEANTAGTVFNDGPEKLICTSGSTAIYLCNFVDCTPMYGITSGNPVLGSSVVVIEHGGGRVIFLGFAYSFTGYEVNGFHTNCSRREDDWVVSILRSSLLLAAGGAV